MPPDVSEARRAFEALVKEVRAKGNKAKVGTVIKQFLDAMGLSVADLVVATHVTATTVYRWLGDQYAPSAAKLPLFEQLLQLPPNNGQRQLIDRRVLGFRSWDEILADLQGESVRELWLLPPWDKHPHCLSQQMTLDLTRLVRERPVTIYFVYREDAGVDVDWLNGLDAQLGLNDLVGEAFGVQLPRPERRWDLDWGVFSPRQLYVTFNKSLVPGDLLNELWTWYTQPYDDVRNMVRLLFPNETRWREDVIGQLWLQQPKEKLPQPLCLCSDIREFIENHAEAVTVWYKKLRKIEIPISYRPS